jgi:hypothetical protein
MQTWSLLVRGYDHALWHCVYNKDTAELRLGARRRRGCAAVCSGGCCQSRRPKFDVYAVLADNLVYRQQLGRQRLGRRAGRWWTWKATGPPWAAGRWCPKCQRRRPWSGTARSTCFRLGSDNTLRWRHYNGAAWGNWTSLGGALASGPTATALPGGEVRVFARGGDEAVWTRSFQGGWGGWQRIEREVWMRACS